MDETQIINLLGLLSAAYPKAEIPAQTIKVYQLLLQAYESEIMVKATLLHIASSRWFPTIQELIEARGKVINAENGIDESAMAAWQQVMDAIMAGNGRDSNPDTIPGLAPMTRIAARRVGWWTICMSENVGVERAHFIQAYKDIKDSSVTNELVESIKPIYTQAAALLGGGRRELTEGER